MRADEASSDVPFEASQADTSAYGAGVGWSPVYDLERAIPEIIAYEKAKRPAQEKPAQLPRNVSDHQRSKKVPMVRALQDAAHKLHPECKVIAGDIDNNA